MLKKIRRIRTRLHSITDKVFDSPLVNYSEAYWIAKRSNIYGKTTPSVSRLATDLHRAARQHYWYLEPFSIQIQLFAARDISRVNITVICGRVMWCDAFCYVHFLTEIRFWYQLIARAFPRQNVEFLFRYRNGEKWLYWSSSSNLSGCAKALCPFHSSTEVLSLTVDLISRPTSLPYDM